VADKFYRTVFHVEVLSNEPLVADELSMSDVDYLITDGHCSGIIKCDPENEEVTRDEMAALLTAQGSDPEFLLDGDCLDIDDDYAAGCVSH